MQSPSPGGSSRGGRHSPLDPTLRSTHLGIAVTVRYFSDSLCPNLVNVLMWGTGHPDPHRGPPRATVPASRPEATSDKARRVVLGPPATPARARPCARPPSTTRRPPACSLGASRRLRRLPLPPSEQLWA